RRRPPRPCGRRNFPIITVRLRARPEVNTDACTPPLFAPHAPPGHPARRVGEGGDRSPRPPSGWGGCGRSDHANRSRPGTLLGRCRRPAQDHGALRLPPAGRRPTPRTVPSGVATAGGPEAVAGTPRPEGRIEVVVLLARDDPARRARRATAGEERLRHRFRP